MINCRSFWQPTLYLFLVLSITSCSRFSKEVDLNPLGPGVAVSEIKHFRAKGRLRYKTSKESGLLNFRWDHLATGQYLDLFGLFSTGHIRISAIGEQVWISDGKNPIRRGKDIPSLLQQSLKLELPILALQDWILGRPSSQLSSAELTTAAQLENIIHQGNWIIEYIEYQSYSEYILPTLLNMQNFPGKRRPDGEKELAIRIRIEDWEIPNG